MPTLATMPAPQKTRPLFIGLQSYTEEQADIFFGRNDEVNRVTNLVKANTLTIVFGKSGTGKTSLLNAGVFPRLRKDYCLPFRIRLEFGANSPDLVTQIKNVLKTEIDKYGFTVESYPGDETLWEYFHREPLWRSVTPILIFDQFEEIFTLGRKNTKFTAQELNTFWEELADLIENSIPEQLKETILNDRDSLGFHYNVAKAKVLFSFREEYLPEFESIVSKIPSLKYSRFRLLPMNGNQAYEVITKTWGSNINPAQATQIVEFFLNRDGEEQPFETMVIEPSLLSQVCSLIDKERIKEQHDKISAAFLSHYSKDIIMRTVYNDVLAESNAAVHATNKFAAGERPVNVFVEDKLITDEGYRTTYILNENDKNLKPGIAVLKHKYFIRGEDNVLELTHDVLTPLIKRDREERRKALAMEVARKKAQRRSLMIVGVALLTAIGFWVLFTWQAKRDKEAAIKDKNFAVNQKYAAIKAKDLAEKKSGELKKEIAAENSRLNKIIKEINRLRGLPLSDSTLGDSVPSAQREEELRQLAFLQQENRRLADQKGGLETRLNSQNMQFASFTEKQKNLETINAAARLALWNLQLQRRRDSTQLDWYTQNYGKIRSEYEEYRRTHPFRYPPESPEPEELPDDNRSLKLNLYYNLPKSNPAKADQNLKVYLIPITADNKKIIKAARTYEIRCNEMNLDAAKGKKIARNVNGLYTFFNVSPGKYFVKICAYYGGYYTVQKKGMGNDTLRLDASPPIR